MDVNEQMTIKLYTEDNHAPPSMWRSNLIMPLKAHWGDGTLWDKDAVAYLREVFTLVDTIREADIVALPLAWNYYAHQGRVHLATDLAARAARFNKLVMVWSEGDNGARIPFDNVLLLQYSIEHSKRRPYEYARAPFSRDYAALHLNGVIPYRPKPPKPLVGFCGQAVAPRPWLIRARNLYRNAEARLKTVYFDPPTLTLPVNFRADVLRRLDASAAVNTRFIVRDNYGGGQRDQTAVMEYVNNLRDTDYTVCMRGWGNYSIRFCETLSMGRIPVFVDTDCSLPFDFQLDWRQYCVWVDSEQLDTIGEQVAAFHARLSPGEFTDLQRDCRRVWEEYLTQEQYYRRFHAHLVDAGIPVRAP